MIGFHPQDLIVIAVVSNPARFRSRYKLFKDFEQHVKAQGARMITVEIAFGERPFECTIKDHPDHVQLRTWFELWHKENMINLGIEYALQRFPEAEYFAWVDADISFARPDWAIETLHQLQHYQFVQMWSHAIDLSPEYGPIQSHNSFVWSYFQNDHRPPQGCGYGGYYGAGKAFWHPGYAWAARREALDHVGGLVDWAILGAADHHMALALIGCVDRSYPKDISESYARKLRLWQARAERFIQRDIGYVPGTILHHWHGKKRDRKYVERWKIINKDQYDPDLDLKRDSQGLWQLTDRNPKLRDDIRRYMRQRNEDSIDLE